MQNFIENISLSIEGHVQIFSYSDREGSDKQMILNKRNAIHKENMSLSLARALAGLDSGHVYSMNFGTGGATVDQAGAISYADPNVSGSADLNVPAYFEVVDTKRGAPDGNIAATRHVSGTVFSDVEIRCVLDKGEPLGQSAFDNISANIDGAFVFDEIALKTDDDLLLTHIVFNPIEKTANRVFEIVYTIRIRVV
tara:strand:+ start:2311 stop:2898 length:588 start_codon:yes stop_codon:yes gene_type:complete